MSSSDPQDDVTSDAANTAGDDVDSQAVAEQVDDQPAAADQAEAAKDIDVDDSGSDEEPVSSSDAPSPPPVAPPPAAPPAKSDAKPAAEPKNTIRPIKLDGSADMGEEPEMDWYILKVAFNREDSVADALRKKVKMEGMDEYFGDIFVPTEDVATFTRDGKRRITKRKLLPGYIMVNMTINDDSWFLVRETGGISDFTGAAGKPMPMEPSDIERFINAPQVEDEDEEPQIKIGIPFKVGDRVRVKEGNFENQEGDVDAVDEAHGNVTVIINIFGRSVPMELKHWQVEPL